MNYTPRHRRRERDIEKKRLPYSVYFRSVDFCEKCLFLIFCSAFSSDKQNNSEKKTEQQKKEEIIRYENILFC